MLSDKSIILKYIEDGQFMRGQVVMDVKYRKIDRSDIEKIMNFVITGHYIYIGSTLPDQLKRPKTEWDKNYLDLLSYASVAECFNLEYLLYLNEVAEYVNGPCNKKKVGKTDIRPLTDFLKSLESQIFQLENDQKDINKALTKAEEAYAKENTDDCKVYVESIQKQKTYIEKKLNILMKGLSDYHTIITEMVDSL